MPTNAQGHAIREEIGLRGNRVEAGASIAVAETSAGKIRGFIRNGNYTYKGIPYGDTTAGRNRFLPPVPAPSWTGTRSCMTWGPICPQAPRMGSDVRDESYREEEFLFEWNNGVQDENCLCLNVWSPGVRDGGKRPVMVWIHGGHFAVGSSQELNSCHGENLCRRGDVVVVSLNHRLNVFGFLDLSRFGEPYAASGIVGILDIVLALKWVRDNISEFGGDPENVTIFGQSGGGGKVTTLMAMPLAQGLFNKAIVQSNCALKQMPRDLSARVTAEVLSALGLDRSRVSNLHDLPFSDLVEAEQEAMQKLALPVNPARRNYRVRWEPVVDGNILPDHAFDPVAPEVSANVPLLVGTTLNEFVNGIGHPEFEDVSEAEMIEDVRKYFGEPGDRILVAFQKTHPGAKPFDLFSRMYGATVRQSAINQATRKAAQNAAPTFLYWFCWQTPVLDGRPRAYHNAELPFVFDNTDLCAAITGGGEEARALAAKVSDAWVAFARSGNPNHDGLPHWPEFSPDTVPTMIFDRVCEMKNNPDGEERAEVGEA